MVKVKKRSGSLQDFDKAKIEASLSKAGAREEDATKIAENVASKIQEGTTTTEIKQIAATQLREIDERSAQSYETFQKLTE